jgi:hypothetical protein
MPFPAVFLGVIDVGKTVFFLLASLQNFILSYSYIHGISELSLSPYSSITIKPLASQNSHEHNEYMKNVSAAWDLFHRPGCCWKLFHQWVELHGPTTYACI